MRGVHHRRIGAARHIVAVETDVQIAERHRHPEQLLEHVPQPLRQERSAAVNAHQRRSRRLLGIGVALHDLMRDARQRTTHIVLAQDRLLAAGVHS